MYKVVYYMRSAVSIKAIMLDIAEEQIPAPSMPITKTNTYHNILQS